MQKWEYLFITCDYVEDDWRPRYANGKALERDSRWGQMTMYDFCNLVGQEGWELFDWELTGVQTQVSRLAFKRPTP